MKTKRFFVVLIEFTDGREQDPYTVGPFDSYRSAEDWRDFWINPDCESMNILALNEPMPTPD